MLHIQQQILLQGKVHYMWGEIIDFQCISPLVRCIVKHHSIFHILGHISPDRIFSLTISDISRNCQGKNLVRDKTFTKFPDIHFPNSYQIPWHFQVFKTNGHPVVYVPLCIRRYNPLYSHSRCSRENAIKYNRFTTILIQYSKKQRKKNTLKQ